MLATAEGDEPLRVLLAEDNEGDVRLIERALRQASPGCEVYAVDNGVKVLAFLRGGPEYPEAVQPDLVLLDLKLPRKTGLEVLAELKRDPNLRRIPVVVLSSSRADHDIARAYELHATAYVSKPVSDYREVIDSIVRFVRTAEWPRVENATGRSGQWDETDGFVRPAARTEDKEIGLNPITTPQGPLALCSVLDITERKQAQESLEARSRELLRSNAELEQFAYVASHDLQEPLRMVASYTSLLAEEYGASLDADAKLYIHFAKDGAERMQQLIHDLLSYSRISSRRRALVPVSGSECLDLALANLRISLDETGSVIRRRELPTVLGDRSQIVDLFQNLIANAIKFRRGVPPVIEVSGEFEPGGVRFAVRDNGIGMEPQYFEEVFQVFRRLHTKEEYPGTGIGLAICKRIVERVGGRIWVESVFGQGSTFYFTWPAPASKSDPG